MQTVTSETDGASLTEFLMLNTGESPSVAVESTLSSILEANAPEKYYLSAKACEGILRRAQRRGKALPQMLKLALEQMIEREKKAETKLTGTECLQPVAYSFDSLASNSMKSKNPNSGCRQIEVAKTLDTTDPNPCKNQGEIAIVQPVCKTWDARGNGDGKTANTLTGDHENRITDYTSVVIEPTLENSPVYCLQGNGIDRADTAGCNGKGWNDETCYTLNTIDRPAVAYLASGKEAVGTLMANASTKLWLGNQEAFSGDYAVLENHKTHYIVRRLTPTECARLQGFADRWGDIEQKDSLTDEEYQFWHEVRNTHAAINGKTVKDYSKTQMLSWYNKLHTDSSEYKMWGNGIALPTALYCMQGIAEAAKRYNEEGVL